MNIKIIGAAICIAISGLTINVQAQKKYTEGVMNYQVQSPLGQVEGKSYFKGDSSLYSAQQGPANVKIISTNNGNYFAILVDVPVASIKKAAVATPAEIEEAKMQQPKFTFSPTTETKQINGFNCKKVVVKNEADGKTFDAWVTNDISTPPTLLSHLLKDIGGVPVQFTTFQMNSPINVTLKGISNEKVPAGTFVIPTDFEKISMSDLKSMGGGN